METTGKAIVLVFPAPSASYLTPRLPHVAPHGTARPSPLGICDFNDLSFQEQSSSDLLASSHLNNNKPYVLK